MAKRSLGIAATLAAVASATAQAGPPAIVEEPHHVTQATIDVDAPPADVYSLVTDYAHWPEILTDVQSVTVKSGGRDDAVVRFKSRAIGRTVTVKFDNIPDRAIRFRGIDGPPGGRASGTYLLEPIDGGTHTRVTASFYMDVVGLPGAFVSGSYLRRIRQTKLRADMTDVARRFAG